MPTYNFKCRQCEEKFSLKATIKEKNQGLNPTCPECDSEDVFQTFDSVGILGSSCSSGGLEGGCNSCSSGADCC